MRLLVDKNNKNSARMPPGMIPPRHDAADAGLAHQVRLRIKEQDRSAQNIDVQTLSNGLIIASFERDGLMDEQEFRTYMERLGFRDDNHEIRRYGERLTTYVGQQAFFQVYAKETRESI